MSLGQCPSGRHRWPDLEAIQTSKRFLAGDREAASCRYGCGGYHLEPARTAATGTKPPKPARDTGPDQATREAVYIRDGYACTCCGTPVEGRPHSVGHRKRRSQGGPDTMDNLLTFLGLGSNPLDPGDHHARIDSRIDPHDEAAGYTCRSFKDPALVGVMYMSPDGSGVLMYLGADGSLTPDPPEGVAA